MFFHTHHKNGGSHHYEFFHVTWKYLIEWMPFCIHSKCLAFSQYESFHVFLNKSSLEMTSHMCHKNVFPGGFSCVSMICFSYKSFSTYTTFYGFFHVYILWSLVWLFLSWASTLSTTFLKSSDFFLFEN